MNVKKFTAPTSREALRKVRDALGPDAVILSNRPVDGVVEILGRGVYLGQDRVRQYMRNLSPGNVGPRDGSLFNHMHLRSEEHV